MMNYNNNMRIVSAFIGNYDEKIHMRELERRTGIDIKILHSSLKELVSANVLNYERKGNMKLFFLKKTVNCLNFVNLCESYSAYEFLNRNKTLKPILKDLSKECDFIVFGSFAKGREKEGSDLDLIVFSEEKRIKSLCSNYDIDCHIHFSHYDAFLGLLREGNKLVKEVVKDHVFFCDFHSFNKVILLE